MTNAPARYHYRPDSRHSPRLPLPPSRRRRELRQGRPALSDLAPNPRQPSDDFGSHGALLRYVNLPLTGHVNTPFNRYYATTPASACLRSACACARGDIYIAVKLKHESERDGTV